MAELTTSWQQLAESHVLDDGYGSLYVQILAKRGDIDLKTGKCPVYYQAKTRYTSSYIQDGSGKLTASGTGASSASASATRIEGSSPVTANASGTIAYGADGTATGSASATLNMPNWGKSATANASFSLPSVPAPEAPESCSNVREGDSKNLVSWSLGQGAAHYAGIKLERSVDGGAWSEIADLAPNATSYADTATSPNHFYSYRVRAYNFVGFSDYAVSPATYNTPAAPTSVTASRASDAQVLLAIANPAKTASALELQRSGDGASWVTVATVEGTVTQAVDSPGGGTFYYRARNVRGDLASEWSPTSNAVVTITPPNAPTLKLPASGAVVPSSAGTVEFQWSHNPQDGSAQTAAQFRYSADSGSSWAEVQIDGGSQSSSAAMPPVNSTVTWQVRTKGAHEDYGPWSATRVFYVKAAPTVYFQEPSDGFSLAQMPLSVKVSYDDESGALAASTLSVTLNGATVYTRDMGAETEALIQASDWLPENGETYVLRVDVRSSSSLTAYAVREMPVDFTPPMGGSAEVTYDIATGHASMILGTLYDGALAPVSSMAVWRVSDRGKVLLADGLQEGAAVVDRYAPVNADYSYEVVTFAETGAYSVKRVPARLSSPWFYFYFEEGIAKGMFNPKGSIKATRPDKRRRHFAGRPLPVSFDTFSFADERSVTMLLRTRAEADEFRRMVENGGRCVYKSGDGDVMHADVEASLKPAYTRPTYYGEASVTLHRIDGKAL